MSHQRDFNECLTVALGTPETVNFKALHILLNRIIEALLILYKQTGITSPIDVDGKKVDSRRSSLVLSPGVDASVVEATERKQSTGSRKKAKKASTRREEDDPSKYRTSKVKLPFGKTAKKSPDVPETKRQKLSKTSLLEEKDVKHDESDLQTGVPRPESDVETIDAKDDAESFDGPLQDGVLEVGPLYGSVS